MDYSQAFAELLKDGADNLWRAVNAMPAEKLDWRPAADARTAREVLEEIVSVNPYIIGLLKEQKNPAEMEQPELSKDMDELEKLHRRLLVDLSKAIADFPADKLHDTIDLPWGNQSFLQVIAYSYWNLMYHYGQIAYIQTMYGDKEVH